MGIYEVVGGASTGGIVVKVSKSKGSEEMPERLVTGSLLRKIELCKGRLKYLKLSGTGPDTGWVSLKFKNTLLVIETDKEAPPILWDVVGGHRQGGILVREEYWINSKEIPIRLSTGAVLKELDLCGDRLQFEKVSGSGPPTGWVSTSFKNVQLVKQRSYSPADSPAAETKPALDITMFNPDKDFSYEGHPSWVPWEAAVARLWRENKPFLPLPVEDKPQGSLKPMAPFQEFSAKLLKEASKLSLPGCMSGLNIPKSADELVSNKFGPEWLTEAFHAAGTLPSDNQVTKIIECKELPTSGFDTAGGAAMKMCITVKYLHPDPELHSELFAKYPYPYQTHPGLRLQLSAFNDIDGTEIRSNMDLVKLLPFRTAKFYFGDICRETTDWILITERIPFGKRCKFEMGKCVEEVERKPYEIHPASGKCQDWLLPDPAEFYCCLFRVLGRAAAWDKLGHYDSFFGPQPTWDEQAFLKSMVRRPMPKSTPDEIKNTAARLMDQGIDFIMNVIKRLAPVEIQDIAKLTQVKEDVLEFVPYMSDMCGYYQQNNSKYIAAVHANLQPDNAFFWQDEYGDLSCGVLDFGAFGRGSIVASFIGCLIGADADIMMAHEDSILRSFVDEYHRCGAPQRLDLEEVRLRYHLLFMSVMYDSLQWIERDIYKLTSKESFAEMQGTWDPTFQGIIRVRCRTLTIINCFHYYLKRGTFKTTFDKWADGVGKCYLTQYTA